jgi:SAM-dependent methyltransferase
MTEAAHNEVVRQSFTRQTALFSGPDSPFAVRERTALSWLEPLTADMILLDVACGAAHVTGDVAPRVRQAVGVDLTPALLQIGAERLREAGVTNVLLQEGDVNALPFVDGSFDVVVCRSSMHHFAAPEQPLREMARVCRPGGRVAVLDLVVPGETVRETYDDLHRALDPSHVAVLTERELAGMMEELGGPIVYGSTTEGSYPLDLIVSDVADRDAVTEALHRELDGGPPTGFDPVVQDDKIVVTFVTTVLQAEVR